MKRLLAFIFFVFIISLVSAQSTQFDVNTVMLPDEIRFDQNVVVQIISNMKWEYIQTIPSLGEDQNCGECSINCFDKECGIVLPEDERIEPIFPSYVRDLSCDEEEDICDANIVRVIAVTDDVYYSGIRSIPYEIKVNNCGCSYNETIDEGYVNYNVTKIEAAAPEFPVGERRELWTEANNAPDLYSVSATAKSSSSGEDIGSYDIETFDPRCEFTRKNFNPSFDRVEIEADLLCNVDMFHSYRIDVEDIANNESFYNGTVFFKQENCGADCNVVYFDAPLTITTTGEVTVKAFGYLEDIDIESIEWSWTGGATNCEILEQNDFNKVYNGYDEAGAASFMHLFSSEINILCGPENIEHLLAFSVNGNPIGFIELLENIYSYEDKFDVEDPFIGFVGTPLVLEGAYWMAIGGTYDVTNIDWMFKGRSVYNEELERFVRVDEDACELSNKEIDIIGEWWFGTAELLCDKSGEFEMSFFGVEDEYGELYSYDFNVIIENAQLTKINYLEVEPKTVRMNEDVNFTVDVMNVSDKQLSVTVGFEIFDPETGRTMGGEHTITKLIEPMNVNTYFYSYDTGPSPLREKHNYSIHATAYYEYNGEIFLETIKGDNTKIKGFSVEEWEETKVSPVSEIVPLIFLLVIVMIMLILNKKRNKLVVKKNEKRN